MFFNLYGQTAGFQLLGWLLTFVGLILANEFARRTKFGGITCFVVIPALLSIYFIAIYIGAACGANWALTNSTYVHMNRWFHYAKLYAATIGCIGFMVIKRSVEQKKNPYTNEIFSDTKDFALAMARKEDR